MEQFRTGVLTVTQPGADVKLELSVLGLMEEGQWCAIALEMSLRGYGSTFDAAFEQLRDAVKAQVTSAVEHGQLDQLIFAAKTDMDIPFAAAKKSFRMPKVANEAPPRFALS